MIDPSSQVRQIPFRMRRRGASGLAFLAALSMAALGYAQSPLNPPAPPMPGRLVATDAGHRLHLWCTGKGAAPTVILIDGAGGFSMDWALVQPFIAEDARVCSYDRAGFAWSDKGPAPRGVGVSADELHQVLRRADVPGPYVLAGVSMGGQIARVYAHRYPDEVAGVVLIDSSLEDKTAAVPDDILSSLDTRAEQESNPADHLPPDLRAASIWARGLMSKEKPPPTMRDGPIEIDLTTNKFSVPMWLEISDFSEPPQAVAATMKGTPVPLGDKPLFVISAGRLSSPPGANGASYLNSLRAHIANQAYAAGLSRNSQFAVARASYHAVIFYEPELVTKAILQVLTSARTGERLKPVQ